MSELAGGFEWMHSVGYGALDHELPRLICAWCDRVLREGSEPASHGICEDCLVQFAKHVGERIPGGKVVVL